MFGSKGKGGLGNTLVFYPAAYALAILQGRQIVFTDGTHPAYVCATQINCTVPTSSDMHKKDINFHRIIGSQRTIKAWDLWRWAGGEDKLDNQVVHATGFLEKTNWFLGNKDMKECVKKLTGCQINRDMMHCMETVAFESLLSKPFKAEYLNISSLVGEESKINSVFQKTLEERPKFDIGVHVRFQFPHFENHTDPNDPNYAQTVKNLLDTPSTKIQFDNIIWKIKHEIAKMDKNKNSLNHLKNTTTIKTETEIAAVNNTNSVLSSSITPIDRKLLGTKTNTNISSITNQQKSIFLASDSEIMKIALADRLESLGYLVNYANTGGIRHSVYFKDKHGDVNQFYAVYDWVSLANSATIIAWRKVAPKFCLQFLSTFALSAQRYLRPPAYVLCDASKIDTHGHVWKHFY